MKQIDTIIPIYVIAVQGLLVEIRSSKDTTARWRSC